MDHASSEQTAAQSPGDISYAYKASLIGSAHRFDLSDDGLRWRIGHRSGVWRYTDIAAVRLSYRPVSMQSRRFRTDIKSRKGERLAILSTTWQTAALMVPQDSDYRAFVVELHRRLATMGNDVVFIGGIGHVAYTGGIAVLVLLAISMIGLFVRAVAVGEFAGALFLVGFAALFGWQIGGFMFRNKPRTYTCDAVPKELLP